MIWPFYTEQQPIPRKTLLIEGYEPFGDDHVVQRFWLLTEYIGGSRTVEKLNGAILPIHDGMDMSIPARVRAWELGGPIAQPLIIDLTKLDRALEKAVIQ